MSPSGLGLDETLERIERELEAFRASLPRVPPGLPRDVSLLLEHIHEGLFDPGLSIASARRACGLRSNNVSGRFRRSLGIAPRQYLERLRIYAASYLLRLDGPPVYIVAAAVGYEHAETFARAFSRTTGMTATELQSRAATGAPPEFMGRDEGARESLKREHQTAQVVCRLESRRRVREHRRRDCPTTLWKGDWDVDESDRSGKDGQRR
jgi:AraC-like DNA-binding protein